MKRILAVITHGKVAHLTNTLTTKNWNDHFDEIHFITPADDRLNLASNEHSLGVSEHHGVHTINRMILGLNVLLENSSEGDLLCLSEYDTFFTKNFKPEIAPDEFSGTRFSNGDSKFNAMYYYHCPWILGRETIKEILNNPIRGELEYGFPDRWLGNITNPLKFKLLKSYSQNSLDNIHVQDECINSVLNGAQFVHGIKNIAMVLALKKADEL